MKVKLQMAAFLQDTIEEMAVTSKNPKKVESVQEFANFIKRVSVDVIMSSSKTSKFTL